METGSGSCLSDRNIKIVFVCALSQMFLAESWQALYQDIWDIGSSRPFLQNKTRRGRTMSEVKNKKNKSSMIQVSIGVLAVILAILIIIMMGIVSDIQGTARIVNYTGLVRGETQRIIKLEVAGEQDDAMIQEVRSFIDGLRNGNTKLNLVYLNDTDFQNKMQELDEGFSDLYKEICLGRSERIMKKQILYPRSEDFFVNL